MLYCCGFSWSPNKQLTLVIFEFRFRVYVQQLVPTDCFIRPLMVLLQVQSSVAFALIVIRIGSMPYWYVRPLVTLSRLITQFWSWLITEDKKKPMINKYCIFTYFSLLDGHPLCTEEVNTLFRIFTSCKSHLHELLNSHHLIFYMAVFCRLRKIIYDCACKGCSIYWHPECHYWWVILFSYCVRWVYSSLAHIVDSRVGCWSGASGSEIS